MIKVFIIDDSLLARTAIKKILLQDKEIEVIGEAQNPVDAFVEFKRVGLPDVFILDLEMPKMNGLQFLKKLKEQKPIPTVVCSAYVEHGSSYAIDSLRYGASDIVLKPKLGMTEADEIADELIEKVKAAAKSKPNFSEQKSVVRSEQVLKNTVNVVAIGVSTGGVQTLEKVFVNLMKNHPPIVVVQHMPAGFTKSFANSLNQICQNSEVKEAQEGDELKNSQILIAPGNKHLEVISSGLKKYKVTLKDYPKVSNHKPSVDVLFTSVAKSVKRDAVAFILTGMGRDGASGIKKILEAGGKTYGQDEKSSIVYGMAKVAKEIGGVSKEIPLDQVSFIINRLGM